LLNKTTYWIVITYVGYSLGAYALLFLLNKEIPVWVESLIVILALPLQLLFTPWIELLHSIGLTEGEWIKAPTLSGFLLVTAIHAVVLYALLWAIVSIIRRWQRQFDR